MDNLGGNNTDFNQYVGTARNQYFYEKHPVFGLVPLNSDIDNRQWGDISSIYEEILSSGTLSTTNLTNNILLQKKLSGSDHISHWNSIQLDISSKTGFRDFSLLAQGTGTIVLLAKSDTDLAVLRIHAHPDTGQGKRGDYKNDCVRPPFTGLLQGLREPMDIADVIRIEFLPFTKVVTLLGEDKNQANMFFQHVTQNTCFDVELSEAAILPDATLMAIDPGDCKYVESFWDLSIEDQEKELSRSMALIESRLRMQSIPEGLQWLDFSGNPKQQSFFPNGNKLAIQEQTLEV